jgi:hypothetical protein
MKKNLRHKFYGDTVEEWIEKVPGELAVDAVGLWQIVSTGREGFGLSAGELVDYVRRNLLALSAKGAKPVQGALDNVHIWTLVDYGDTAEEMADAIINEWLNSGRDPDVGDVWFALPHIYEEKRSHDSPQKTKGSLS